MTAMIFGDPLQRTHYFYGRGGANEVPTLGEDGPIPTLPGMPEAVHAILDPIGFAINKAVEAQQQAALAPAHEELANKIAAMTGVTQAITQAQTAGQLPKVMPAGFLQSVFPSIVPGQKLSGAQVAQATSQAIDQAVGGAPAPTQLGAAFGAGLGGPPILGTGPMPGTLGALLQRTYGQNALPSAFNGVGTGNLTPNGYAGDTTWNALASHSEKVGRAVVRRILGITDPALKKIQDAIALRANQVQATSEHAALMTDGQFKAAVMAHLVALSKRAGVPSSGLGSTSTFKTY